jgi:hypothetical protein
VHLTSAEAARLLAKSGWLPEALRTPVAQADDPEGEEDAEKLSAFLEEGEDDEESHEAAAE